MDHKASGASLSGIPHEKIVAILDFRSSELFTEAERAALELAEAMTITPPVVTDDLYRRVGEHFAEGQVVELAGRIAVENFRSRINRCFDVQPTNVYSRLSELLSEAKGSATAR